ncbi:MAG: ABC transporter permease [Arenicellales bacterium]|nr:ABC transporter [Acidiferrobacteraceae bacterium]MDP6122478.1 ABC transporter permease [Arenicellales bacterium]MBT58346.1 ABC transporter [Acidiferrobacteraceae bacterium]MDP6289987.1 ABC transporter permease [Arenicellales bacterium]MDP6434082.1 ABC transporter permease [Arenicellales bacterium]
MFDLKGYLPMILDGMVITIEVALLSLTIAVILGIAGASAKLSGSRIAYSISTLYTTLIRGIPDLVLMTLIFFGGQILINNLGDQFGWDYIDISPFIAGTATIGFIFGAYMTETFRGAILAIDRGQIEAAQAFGMSRLLLFVRITLPQMVRHALPGFGNNWMVLAKTTALVSVIGLHDMVYNANLAGGSTRQPFTFYLVVALLYLAITGISDLLLHWANRRFSIGIRQV